MSDLLENSAVKSLAGRLRTIPSLPTVFHELTAPRNSNQTSLSQLEKILAKDVAMKAKTLQLANSAE